MYYVFGIEYTSIYNSILDLLFSLDPPPKPKLDNGLNHKVQEKEICIIWPLSPELRRLLQEPTLDVPSVDQNTPAPLSRSVLIDVLNAGEILYKFYSRIVVHVSPDIVVKLCKNHQTTELHNLQHIRHHLPEFPVPVPLGMLTIGTWSYVFMSFIPGVPLNRIWNDLSVERKKYVRDQLNTLFTEIRSLPLPSHEGHLGGGTPPQCEDGRHWNKTSSATSPIRSESQFNAFILTESSLDLSRLAFLGANMSGDHRIVMTHGDLLPRNLLVASADTPTITGIVDWESGGGYPEYWEYVKALNDSFTKRENDWYLYLPEVGIGKYFGEWTRDAIISRYSTG